METKKKLWLTIYIIVLLGLTITTVCWFNKITFGVLFTLIAIWPVGQFFLNKKN